VERATCLEFVAVFFKTYPETERDVRQRIVSPEIVDIGFHVTPRS